MEFYAGLFSDWLGSEPFAGILLIDHDTSPSENRSAPIVTQHTAACLVFNVKPTGNAW